FEIRKNLIEYDEVMNEQRKLIYDQRQDALEANGLNETVRAMFENMIQETTERYAGDGRDVPVDYDALATWAQRKWDWPGQETDLSDLKYEQVPALFLDDALSRLDGREEELGADTMRSLERFLVLNAIDNKWKEHLLTMDSLRAGVGLRSYAQVDPKTEYKREGLEQFKKLLDQVADEVTNFILRVQIKQEDETRLGSAYEGAQASHPAFGGQAQATAAQPQQPPRRQVAVGYSAPSQTHSGNPYAKQQKDMEAASAPMTEAPEQVSKPKVARNAPCPCGSGKKYKQCCGKA
ncbi:MAG: hypothetical protein HOM34_05935, partial [Planctomycetes bacterium]|nr:hypothetical protein [Planctomycetota bacterium]